MGERRTPNIRTTKSGKYEARFYDPNGRRRQQTFNLLSEAKSFLASAETDKRRGDWVDPRLGKTLLSDYTADWLETHSHLRPASLLKVQGHIRNYILPTFGHRPLSRIRTAEVRAWVTSLLEGGLAAGTVTAIYRTFANILKTAAIDGLIHRSPCIDIRLPEQSREEMKFLTAAQAKQLAESVASRYFSLILTAAYTGLRWSELAGLKVERLNLLRGTLDVTTSLSEVNGVLHTVSPKSDASRRTVSLPRFLCDILGRHIGEFPGENGYVFTSAKGGPLRRNFYRREFLPALVRSGLDPDLCLCDDPTCEDRHTPRYRFHDLRHTCAALLIAQGAHPKEIQERLGHSTIRMTFDRYGHLFPSLDERLRDRLDKTYADADLPNEKQN